MRTRSASGNEIGWACPFQRVGNRHPFASVLERFGGVWNLMWGTCGLTTMLVREQYDGVSIADGTHPRKYIC